MTVELELSDDHARLDLELITSWSRTAYWSPGVSRDVVSRAAAASAFTGAYELGTQIGYCRLVSDRVTFAWLADVWVAEHARGRGVGRWPGAEVERPVDRVLVTRLPIRGRRRASRSTGGAGGVVLPAGRLSRRAPPGRGRP